MKNLQLVLGIDKNNPLFSIYSPEDNPEQIEVYFGMALLEKMEKGKDSLMFKLLLGRLYNMKFKLKDIVEAFEIDPKTIRKWGKALKSGDFDVIEKAFSGRENSRKLTPEIESYARSRYKKICFDNRHNYSSVIREEIEEHFQTILSAETLRHIFNEEKKIRK